MITKYDVKRGYKDGAIQLIESPNSDGTVCQIGESWFYFGGRIAKEYSPKEYKKHVPEEDIIQEIYDTLDEMESDKDIFGDKCDYYESFLDAVCRAKYKVMVYTGDTDQNYFFESIRNALKKYVELRWDHILNYKSHITQWLTIWVRTDEGFRRVHDFDFCEVTDKNIEKYLAERITDADELLAGAK